MIVPDVNLLLYAEIDAFEQHALARRWWEDALAGELQIGLAPVVLVRLLLSRLGIGANLTTDVQIAAHAIEHGGEVHSIDRDFARFDGLRWADPLAK